VKRDRLLLARAAAVAASVATMASGCSVQECTPGCTSGFTVSLLESSGAAMPDGDWTATAIVGSTSGTAKGTIKNGVLIASEGFNEVDKGGVVQELFITVPGSPSAVQVSVTLNGASVGAQTYTSISYSSVDDGCGNKCGVANDKLPL
jgi:hypothetical protein